MLYIWHQHISSLMVRVKPCTCISFYTISLKADGVELVDRWDASSSGGPEV